jgi:hypothetical protein
VKDNSKRFGESQCSEQARCCWSRLSKGAGRTEPRTLQRSDFTSRSWTVALHQTIVWTTVLLPKRTHSRGSAFRCASAAASFSNDVRTLRSQKEQLPPRGRAGSCCLRLTTRTLHHTCALSDHGRRETGSGTAVLPKDRNMTSCMFSTGDKAAAANMRVGADGRPIRDVARISSATNGRRAEPGAF